MSSCVRSWYILAEGDYDDNIEADENSYNDDEEESSEEGDAEEESV